MDDQVVFVNSLANVVVDYLSVLDPQHHVAHVLGLSCAVACFLFGHYSQHHVARVLRPSCAVACFLFGHYSQHHVARVLRPSCAVAVTSLWQDTVITIRLECFQHVHVLYLFSL